MSLLQETKSISENRANGFGTAKAKALSRDQLHQKVLRIQNNLNMLSVQKRNVFENDEQVQQLYVN